MVSGKPSNIKLCQRRKMRMLRKASRSRPPPNRQNASGVWGTDGQPQQDPRPKTGGSTAPAAVRRLRSPGREISRLCASVVCTSPYKRAMQRLQTVRGKLSYRKVWDGRGQLWALGAAELGWPACSEAPRKTASSTFTVIAPAAPYQKWTS